MAEELGDVARGWEDTDSWQGTGQSGSSVFFPRAVGCHRRCVSDGRSGRTGSAFRKGQSGCRVEHRRQGLLQSVGRRITLQASK